VFYYRPSVYGYRWLAGLRCFLLRPAAVRVLSGRACCCHRGARFGRLQLKQGNNRTRGNQPLPAQALPTAELLVAGLCPFKHGALARHRQSPNKAGVFEIVTGLLDGDSPLMLEYFSRARPEAAQLLLRNCLKPVAWEWFTRFSDYQHRNGEITANRCAPWAFPGRTLLHLSCQ